MPSYYSCTHNEAKFTQCLKTNGKNYTVSISVSTQQGTQATFVISVEQACRPLSRASSTDRSPPKMSFLFNSDDFSDLASRVFPEKQPQQKTMAVVLTPYLIFLGQQITCFHTKSAGDFTHNQLRSQSCSYVGKAQRPRSRPGRDVVREAGSASRHAPS